LCTKVKSELAFLGYVRLLDTT